MPTDLSAAIALGRAARIFAAREEFLLVFLSTVPGFVSVVLAVQSPVITAALILSGSQ
jgi:hypothetical protein